MKSVHEQLAAALSRSKPKSKKANKKEMKQRQKEIERTTASVKPKNKPVKSKPKKPQAKYVWLIIVLVILCNLIGAFAEYQLHPLLSKEDLQVVTLVQMKRKPNQ